jgi:hypothetical protein
VLPAYRKKREYWLALLAKHEIGNNNPNNKKLFSRVQRGGYVLNTTTLIRFADTWLPVHQIINSQGDATIRHCLDAVEIVTKKQIQTQRKTTLHHLAAINPTESGKQLGKVCQTNWDFPD